MFKKLLNKNTLFASYCTVALGVANVACAHDHAVPPTVSHTTMKLENPNTNPAVSDIDLSKKIHDKIGSGWFSTGYDQVIVQVNNGVVTLEGFVNTWDDKNKVEKEVRNIDGVKSLTTTNLQVRDINSPRNHENRFAQDLHATAADEQLNKKIRDNVSKGWVWDSYKEVALNTTNGVVTLTGTVDNLDDQQKLVTHIQVIDGVKAVKSDLRIKNP